MRGLCLRRCPPGLAAEQTAEFPVIWDVLMWRDCNDWTSALVGHSFLALKFEGRHSIYPIGIVVKYCFKLLYHAWWRHQMETFSALLAICAGNSPVIGEFLQKAGWHGALMFSLICAWINGWVNNGDAGDLTRHRAHYDVAVMVCKCIGAKPSGWYSTQIASQPFNSCIEIFLVELSRNIKWHLHFVSLLETEMVRVDEGLV